MANLSSNEKSILENFLGMGSGYVLDFSSNSFDSFMREHTGISIYDEKYLKGSGSKANRLRAFWEKESNYLVGKTIIAFIEYCKTRAFLGHLNISDDDYRIIKECEKISEKLQKTIPISEISELKFNANTKDLEMLSSTIIENIEQNKPQIGLDRLHTYTIKYFRNLCDIHGIKTDKEMPLHSLAGMYIKFLESNQLIESEMTKKILKSSISILDSFNSVRNNQSFAHDNVILNYDECILIFNSIVNLIKFVNVIELRNRVIEQEDIPF